MCHATKAYGHPHQIAAFAGAPAAAKRILYATSRDISGASSSMPPSNWALRLVPR